MAKEIKPIFLEDNKIAMWSRPGFSPHPLAETVLKEYLGIDSVNLETGNYLVLASAAKYLADVKRHVYPPSETYVPSVLFEGDIQIFEQGTIPGTELQGRYRIVRAPIWTAVPDKPRFRGPDGLAKLIGTNIEKVIRGYEVRQEERDRAARSSLILSRPDRRSSANPEFYGGGGCC